MITVTHRTTLLLLSSLALAACGDGKPERLHASADGGTPVPSAPIPTTPVGDSAAALDALPDTATDGGQPGDARPDASISPDSRPDISSSVDVDAFAADIAASDAAAPPPASLQFASGFEPGFRIGEYFRGGSMWRMRYGGTDRSTGYTWPDDIPSAQKTPEWQFLVCSKSVVQDFVDVRLETMRGPRGTASQALLMKVKDDDKACTSLSRVELVTYPQGPKGVQQYVRYWMKLQPDFLELTDTTRDHGNYWRLFFEVKEPRSGIPGDAGHKYRWQLFIATDERRQPYWMMKGMQGLPTPKLHFAITNHTVPVPLDRWFLVEIFWRQHRTDGRFLLRIDGQDVADHRGRLTHETKPFGIYINSFLKLYVGRAWFAEGGDAYHWIDDLEVHADLP